MNSSLDISQCSGADLITWQKITVISPDTSLVAIGTTENRVTIFRHPFLDDAVYAISLDSELVDLAWEGANGEWVSLLIVLGIWHIPDGFSLQSPRRVRFCCTR